MLRMICDECGEPILDEWNRTVIQTIEDHYPGREIDTTLKMYHFHRGWPEKKTCFDDWELRSLPLREASERERKRQEFIDEYPEYANSDLFTKKDKE